MGVFRQFKIFVGKMYKELFLVIFLELKWIFLDIKKNPHLRKFFFKIFCVLILSFLTSFLPYSVGEVSLDYFLILLFSICFWSLIFVCIYMIIDTFGDIIKATKFLKKKWDESKEET